MNRSKPQRQEASLQRRLLGVGISLALLCSCTDDGGKVGKAAQTGAELPVDVRADGEAVVFSVKPGDLIDEQVGPVRLIAPGTAVKTAGTVTARPVRVASVPSAIDGIDVSPATTGVLVELGDAELSAPISVRFEDVTIEKGSSPIGVHLDAEGDWTLVPDTIRAGSAVVVSTTSFSVISWAQTKVLRPLGDLLARAFAGRTAPAGCSNPPLWASSNPPPSGSDHTCVRTSTTAEVAELEIKSNRGTFHWVQIPSTLPREYVWVEDQSDLQRQFISQLVFGGSESAILLAPGKRMTIGYRQPDEPQQLTYLVYNDVWSVLISVAVEALNFLFDGAAGRFGTLAALNCAGVYQLKGSTPGSLDQPISKPQMRPEFVQCVLDLASELAKNPKKAVNLAADLLGPNSNPDQLTELSEELYVLGKKAKKAANILRLGGWVAKEVTLITDALVQAWGADNASNVVLTMTAKAKPQLNSPNNTPEQIARSFVEAIRRRDREGAGANSRSGGALTAYDYLTEVSAGFEPTVDSIDCRPSGAVVECSLYPATPGNWIYLEKTDGGWQIIGPAWNGEGEMPYDTDEFTAQYCVTDTTPLNIRVGPGVEFPITTSIPVGDCALSGVPHRTELSSTGKPWRLVNWRGMVGLVSAERITQQ